METSSWIRIRTRTGRYDYQFQGAGPAVRQARYEDARDFQFLVLDEEGWLYRIPVRIPSEAEVQLEASAVLRAAEAALRAGLDAFRPRQNAPYEELDTYFALTAERAQALADEGISD